MTQRVKLLMVSPEQFLLRARRTDKVEITVVENPLPHDAKCVGVGHDWQTNCFYLVIESAEFPEIEDGYKLEMLPQVVFKERVITNEPQ